MYTRRLKSLLSKNTPPKKIPHELIDKYTLDGKIIVKYNYRDDTRPVFFPKIYTKRTINSLLSKIEKKQPIGYRMTTQWLYSALNEYPVKGKDVAIMGSTSPVHECICLHFGGRPTTIEYNPIISLDKRLMTVTCSKFYKKPRMERFDAAFSISSFEHDGLCRYGDPIDPEGDLKAMKRMKSVIKKDGLLFLAMPVGKDMIVWNLHRVYGSVRLPLFFEGWKLLKSFGYNDRLLSIVKENGRGYQQPVFVLQNV